VVGVSPTPDRDTGPAPAAELSPEPSPPDGQATRFGGTVAAVAAVATALLLGAASGVGLATVAAVAGGLLAASGVAWTNTRHSLRRSVGSAATVLGAGGVAAGAALPGTGTGALLAVALGGGVGAATLAATERPRTALARPLLRAGGRSLLVVVPVAVVAGLAHHGLFRAFGGTALAVTLGAATASDLALFVSVQVLAVGVAVLLRYATPVVEAWTPDGSEPPDALAAVSVEPDRELARTVGVLFGLEILVALTDWGPALFARVLDLTGVAGAAVRVVLRSLVVHAGLATVAALLAAVLVADAVRDPIGSAADRTPPREVALAGGGAAALVALALTGVPPVGDVVRAGLDAAGWGVAAANLGVGGLVAIGAAALLVVQLLGTVLVSRLGVLASPFAPDRGAAFAAGAALLATGSVVGAELGAPALAVIPGLAGALAVWDVGASAADLGAVVGRDRGTARTEAVHVAGTLLAGAVGTAVALAAAYLLGPIAGVSGAQALVALVLATVALAAFALTGEAG
jgi:hypothetical protein